jgi:hypothetical protein
MGEGGNMNKKSAEARSQELLKALMPEPVKCAYTWARYDLYNGPGFGPGPGVNLPIVEQWLDETGWRNLYYHPDWDGITQEKEEDGEWVFLFHPMDWVQ